MNILHIGVPIMKHSRELSAAVAKKLLEVAPDASISRRDLGAGPLPHTMWRLRQRASSIFPKHLSGTIEAAGDCHRNADVYFPRLSRRGSLKSCGLVAQ
jgi:hypothetical protein